MDGVAGSCVPGAAPPHSIIHSISCDTIRSTRRRRWVHLAPGSGCMINPTRTLGIVSMDFEVNDTCHRIGRPSYCVNRAAEALPPSGKPLKAPTQRGCGDDELTRFTEQLQALPLHQAARINAFSMDGPVDSDSFCQIRSIRSGSRLGVPIYGRNRYATRYVLTSSPTRGSHLRNPG